MVKVQQYNTSAIEIEELKDRNLALYETNMHLQESAAGMRHANRLKEDGSGGELLTKDDAHIKEMLETQNVLREEMQQKDFYKEQAQATMRMYLDVKDSTD